MNGPTQTPGSLLPSFVTGAGGGDRSVCAQGGDEELLTEALALWRGDALTGLDSEWAQAERDRLHQERLAAEHDLVDARLRMGQGEELLAGLSTRVVAHPLDERLAGQYMVALSRSGRSPTPWRTTGGCVAGTLDSLGYIEHLDGHHARAVDYYQQALVLQRELGDTYEAANTLEGHPHAALGQVPEARAAWEEALALYRTQHRTTDAERVEGHLAALAPTR